MWFNTLFGLLDFEYTQIQSTWTQFKCENLDKSNYDYSYGGGDFSHAYVIMHQYFGKKTNNIYTHTHTHTFIIKQMKINIFFEWNFIKKNKNSLDLIDVYQYHTP